MDNGIRITRIGLVLMLLLAGSVIAVLVGSTGVRVAGFAVGALVIVFLVADQLTARVGWFGLITQGRADTRPIGGAPSEPELADRAAEPSEAVWEREQARYREKNAPKVGDAGKAAL